MQIKNNFTINKKDINFVQTLSCGQIFSYKQNNNKFLVFSADKVAKILETKEEYIIQTKEIEYFKNFFDLQTDYGKVKNSLKKFDVLQPSIVFGSGIRILRQNILETIISFCVSANNNIKRITNSLFELRTKFGAKIEDKLLDITYFAFPTLEQLANITEKEFLELGVGYRAKQLVKLINQLKNIDFEKWSELETGEIRTKLIELSGIGPKVADCILLFAYGKMDVFPVDTWIAKVFNTYFCTNKNRIEMRKILVEKFGCLSGYAQQYLFFYARENKLKA